MMRVIDRQLYDTDAAEQIARFVKNPDTSDSNYFIETLYRTDEGEFILHGDGGASTIYAKKAQSGYMGGQELTPLSEEEALDWCEEKGIDGGLVVEEFGHLIDT